MEYASAILELFQMAHVSPGVQVDRLQSQDHVSHVIQTVLSVLEQ